MLMLSFTLAVVAYVILCHGILFKNAVQPLSTTLLWFALDTLAAWTGFVSDGNWLLAAGYATGCVMAIAVSIYRGHTQFAKSDLWVTAMVTACVIVWLTVGDLAGLIASSLAMFIAGVPAIIHYAARPQDGQLSVWLLFSTANLIGLLGRSGNAIEDWVFPALALAGTLIVSALLLKGRVTMAKA